MKTTMLKTVTCALALLLWYPFTGSRLVVHHFSEFATIRPWMGRIESSPNCKS